jgi:hypothetical protein
MRRLMVAGFTALLIATFPLAVMAQASVFEGETREIVVDIVQRVGGTVGGGDLAEASSEEDVEAMPVPQSEEAAEEPGSEVTELPELNLSDLAEYTSQGVSILVPADWVVDTELDSNTPFFIEVPGTNMIISLSSDSELTFPSWLGVTLFRSQADLLVSEIGEEAQLEESTTLYTEQNLPVAKLAFTGMEGDEPLGGAIYALAPNEDAYLLIGGGSAAEWEYAKAGIDLIVQSILFDDDLVDVEWADGEPLVFTDDDETLQVTVPTNWYAMSTGDPQFPIILAEPEVRYIAAVGGSSVFGDDIDMSVLDEYLSNEGVVNPEDYAGLIDTIGEMVSESGDSIALDTELSEVLPREGAALVRLVGSAELEDGVAMPVILYVDLRDSGVGIVTIFGDTESAVEFEDDIQSLVQSVTGL